MNDIAPDSNPVRWARARHPFIYEINTWPWLTDLGRQAGVPMDLSTVPDEEWDAIAEWGFDAVWLMGVWERSPAGVAVALANGDLVAAFTAALPDWAPDDVVGSPYCVRNYVVDSHLGGRAGLAAARSALADRGMALILDFVPNHVAPDHPWTSAHPEYFVAGTAADLLADPESFIAVDGAVLANGRDPYLPAWPDVVQLDASSPALRETAVHTLRDIADQCDGVRCDMAMLVMNGVFTRTWGDRVGAPPAEDYWPTVIGAIRRTHPDFTFIAEAYWDLEWPLQQQGFDLCYDKRLYDRLVAGDAVAVREHLSADADFQSRLLRFAENHDEPRAAATFDSARDMAVTVTTLTQAGARLVHHGQIEGRKVHLPVFLGRSPHEATDSELATFHRSLLATLRDDVFRTGAWSLCEISPLPGHDSHERLVAWCWEGERCWLVVVNLGATDASGRVRRSGDDLRGGLLVELGPWQWRIVEVGGV
ncbi:MAG: alpha-amylase family glycosyl hydrolase [Mycobacterium sp.]